MRQLTLGAAALAFGVWGCGGKSADNAGAGGAASSGGAVAQSGAATGPTGNSTVSGVIHFTGAAPTNPKIDMSQESACQGEAALRFVVYVILCLKLLKRALR